MHHTDYLLQALVYFGAAALFVPVFHKLGLGSVLGYLVAGAAIGPWGVRLVTDPTTVAQVSELGVVLLLFLVGLELNPQRLWSLRRAIFGLGALQVGLTIAAVTALAVLLGQSHRAAVVLGMAAAMSSTAIALQLLAERNLTKTEAGQSAFAVALFQDLSVIPLLLVLASLAPGAGAEGGFSLLRLGQAVLVIGAMVLIGRLALRPVLRWIAAIGMREIFIAFALFLIVGSAWLTQAVGLSMALGSFVAGVLLADSEYRMELEVDIDPFKGLLLGLFFMAVGMSIDVGLILASPLRVAALALVVVVLKLAVLLLLAQLFRLSREDAWIFGLSISQVGEFAFVLLGPAAASGVLEPRLAALANAVVAVSMLSTPLLFLAFERWIRPRLSAVRQRAPDPIEERNPVIVAGVGRFGQIVARLLLGRGCTVTIIDHDPNQVDLLRRFGFRAHYGDAARPDVLEAAGIASTRLLVLAMDDPAAVRATARHVRERHPGVQILARVHGRLDAIELVREGVPIVRETFGASLQAAQAALVALGEHPYLARQAVEQFRRHDEALLREQAAIEGENEGRYLALANEGRDRLAALLAREQRPDARSGERSDW